MEMVSYQHLRYLPCFYSFPRKTDAEKRSRVGKAVPGMCERNNGKVTPVKSSRPYTLNAEPPTPSPSISLPSYLPFPRSLHPSLSNPQPPTPTTNPKPQTPNTKVQRPESKPQTPNPF
jgi:hypothetical protein